jgi:hypothetical protein
MRLLSRVEYDNTIRDLLGDTTEPANAFPAESTAETGFAKVQKIDEVNVGAYLDAADGVAGRATANLTALLRCDPAGAGEDACVRSFVVAFGKRAYRRPLSDAEVGEHMQLYRGKLRTELQLATADAVRGLVSAMLQSPYFLYRWELAWQTGARDGAVVRLGPYHLASQLSYVLWASMPDDALLNAADRNELATPEQVEAQARRMLKDTRAERALASFHEQWLGTVSLPGAARNKALYPSWSPALATAMGEELRRYVADVVLRRDGHLETLLTSTASFVNGPLAAVYGMSGVTGAAFQPVTLPAGQRAGLLTLPGVMAAHADENDSSPILRGKFVREQIMCAPIPPPPGNVPDLPPPSPNVSKKDRFAMHAQGSCKACHDLMDPVGFGFESYDAIGKYRTMDRTFPVDASGTITNLDGADHDFRNGLELVALLAKSDQVRACVARQWFRYGFARNESSADTYSLDASAIAFRASGFDVRELLVALVKSRSFMYRAPGAQEAIAP